MERKAITFSNVDKQYNLNLNQPRLVDLLSKIIKKNRTVANQYMAINNVSFNIDFGEKVGILGQNGSGKSTLLKLISGVSYPTTGDIKVNGSIGGLIELGAGFHSELTGRENIFVNAAILGLSEKEIHEKLDNIIAFSGVDAFIDMPLKHYSSGMKVRLGFSIALVIDSDILLLDEVLAVGDSKFRSKALKAMEHYMAGKTIVFISHDLNQVKKICNRCLVIDQGQLKYDGKTEDAIKFYKDEILNKKLDYYQPFHQANKPSISSVHLLGSSSNSPKGQISHNDDINIELNYLIFKVKYPRVGITIRPKNFKIPNLALCYSEFVINRQATKDVIKIPKIPFYNGEYEIDIMLYDGKRLLQTISEGLMFSVINTNLDYKLEGMFKFQYSVEQLDSDDNTSEILQVNKVERNEVSCVINFNHISDYPNISHIIITVHKQMQNSYLRLGHLTISNNSNSNIFRTVVDFSSLSSGKYELGIMLLNAEKKLVYRKDNYCSFDYNEGQKEDAILVDIHN